MGAFLYLGSYPAEGLQGVIADGGTRREADTRAVFEAVGGRVLVYQFAVGSDFDFVIVAEVPDLASALVPPLLASATGTVDVRTTVLVSPSEVDAITATARGIAFRAAGT